MNYYDDYRAVLVDQSMNIYDANEGFVKGTLFKTLYEPYKNYQPKAIVASTDKEKMMLNIQKLTAACHDLGLYLDVYPKDTNALSLRSKYQKELSEMVKEYDSKYPPFSIDSEYLSKAPWKWSTTSFPWEVKK